MAICIIDTEKTATTIKQLCKDKGLTPKMIAETLSLSSVTAVYKWYSAQALPSIDNLVQLAKLLEVTLDDIVQVKEV